MTYAIKCTAKTKKGSPCKASAIRDSHPPLCSSHSQKNKGAGAPPGNGNAKKHGFYAREYTTQELADLLEHAANNNLDDEIALTRVVLRRLLNYLNNDSLSPVEISAIAPLAFTGSRTVARLLRDARALSGEAADGIAGAIATALDELSTEWGVEL